LFSMLEGKKLHEDVGIGLWAELGVGLVSTQQ
jgi:hypothetical protein